MQVQISGDSIHAVAYALLGHIAQAEQWDAGEASGRWAKTRKEILDTYKECLSVVRGSTTLDKYS